MNTVLVASHDAGGAEFLSSYILRNKAKYQYILGGPALSIYNKKLQCIDVYPVGEMNALIAACDLVLISTSWASDIERAVLYEAKKQGKKCIAFLDHWVNFRERFYFEGHIVLPDEVYVGDEYAFEIANRALPECVVKNISNPYFLDIVQYFSQENFRTTESAKEGVLYVCEPYVEGTKVWAKKNIEVCSINEKKLLVAFLKYAVKFLKDKIITIRTHPSELKNKYDNIISSYKKSLSIKRSEQPDLMLDIQQSSQVYGGSSMALVVGVLAKREVFSCLPENCNIPLLPHKEIQRIYLNYDG